jgi:hypothetical protein
MRRIAMLALAAATAVTVAAPGTANALYDHQCHGTVDVNCYTYYCLAVDCFRADCPVYLNVSTATQARCLG